MPEVGVDLALLESEQAAGAIGLLVHARPWARASARRSIDDDLRRHADRLPGEVGERVGSASPRGRGTSGARCSTRLLKATSSHRPHVIELAEIVMSTCPSCDERRSSRRSPRGLGRPGRRRSSPKMRAAISLPGRPRSPRCRRCSGCGTRSPSVFSSTADAQPAALADLGRACRRRARRASGRRLVVASSSLGALRPGSATSRGRLSSSMATPSSRAPPRAGRRGCRRRRTAGSALHAATSTTQPRAARATVVASSVLPQPRLEAGDDGERSGERGEDDEDRQRRPSSATGRSGLRRRASSTTAR